MFWVASEKVAFDAVDVAADCAVAVDRFLLDESERLLEFGVVFDADPFSSRVLPGAPASESRTFLSGVADGVVSFSATSLHDACGDLISSRALFRSAEMSR